MNDDLSNRAPLTEAGQRRREQIGQLARAAARRRRAKRQIAQTAIGGVAVVWLAVLFTAIDFDERPQPRQDQQDRVAVHAPPATRPAEQTAVIIQRLTTDPDITRRLAVRIDSPIWRTIGDDEFLAALADAGKPSGLVEIDGRTVLLPQHASR